MHQSPDALWQLAWQQLSRANQDHKHPFRTASIATVDTQGFPRARTVVMRKADRQTGSLLLYTDIRSRKVEEWGETNQLHWLFWNPKSQLQLGLRGYVERLERKEELAIFNKLPKHGRKSYATLSAPATPRPANPDGLPDGWEELMLSETDYAAENFAAYRTVLLEADVLQLNRDEGHRRLSASRTDAESDWQLHWITP